MFSIFDAHTLARTIYGEASGENMLTRYGVGWTVRNRMGKHGWPIHAAGVCLQPGQFSCWSQRFALITGLTDLDAVYNECVRIGNTVLGGQPPSMDPTKGATFYHDISISKPEPPHWPVVIRTVQIGKLIFYRLP